MSGLPIFSVNLVEAAKLYAELLAKVREVPTLYEKGDDAQRAIGRYVRFMESARADGPVPLDILWLFCVHCLNPASYFKDCISSCGNVIPYFEGERNFKANFAPAFAEYNFGEKIRTFVPSLDLEAALLRQKGFLLKSATIYSVGDVVLKKVTRKYSNFLRLIKDSGESCTPTLAIDLMWHSHMMIIESYVRDTQNYVGHLINHDDGVEKEILEENKVSTEALWKEKYGIEYNVAITNEKETASIDCTSTNCCAAIIKQESVSIDCTSTSCCGAIIKQENTSIDCTSTNCCAAIIKQETSSIDCTSTNCCGAIIKQERVSIGCTSTNCCGAIIKIEGTEISCTPTETPILVEQSGVVACN